MTAFHHVSRYIGIMDISPEEDRGTSLQPRVAIASIVGFWLFYFTIITVRSLVIGFDDQIGMLLRRLLVVGVCMAVTFVLYLAVRRVTAASLGRAVVTIALLAIPAAIIHSAVNFYAFSSINAMEKAKKEQTRVVVVKTRKTPAIPQPPATDRTGVPVPPLPPMPPEVMTVQIGGNSYDDEHMEKSVSMAITDQAANGYFFFVAWAALYLALCYAAEAVRAERRAASFRAAAQSAELRALRYQVNPHFLFNTLNSMSSLVLGNKLDEAERMIMNLSTFFRTSLTADPTEDVPLGEEIRLQRLYLDIEAVRFPERLVVDIQVPEALTDAAVPALILQPIIENAVKYGVSRAKRPVTIRVRAREEAGKLSISVEDNGEALPDEAPSGGTGVGLRNVCDRLSARFGGAGGCYQERLAGGGFRVTLFMPLIRHGRDDPTAHAAG